MQTNLSAALSDAARRLREAGVPNPTIDAELLAAHVLGETRGRVQALEMLDFFLTDAQYLSFEELVERRELREPLQHITGLAPFRHLMLHVGPGVFIPRPETEWVTQVGIDTLRDADVMSPVVVDLCAGSGAIGLAIATERPDAVVHAVELSNEAYAWAFRNAQEVGAENFSLHLGDLLDAVFELDGSVHLVISNPPYIPSDAVPRDQEVRDFDPEVALYGGTDGLEVIRDVSRTAHRLAVPGGTVVIEHGEPQGAQVRGVLEADGWLHARTLHDLAGRERVTLAVKPQ